MSKRVRDSTKAYRTIYKCVVITFIYVGYMFKCICDLKCDWLRLDGVNEFVCCLCMYRMTIGRLEVRIFFYFREPYH